MRLFQRLSKKVIGLRTDESGVVMLETVLVFPVQLMIMMLIIQIAHIYVTANVLHYAAFQGLRTATVNLRGGNHDEASVRGAQAAWVVISTINNEGGGTRQIRVPANTYVFPSFESEGVQRMQMEIEVPANADRQAQCRMTYWLDLVVPIGGPAIYHIMKEAGHPVQVNSTNRRGMILMEQKARLFKTWPH